VSSPKNCAFVWQASRATFTSGLGASAGTAALTSPAESAPCSSAPSPCLASAQASKQMSSPKGAIPYATAAPQPRSMHDSSCSCSCSCKKQGFQHLYVSPRSGEQRFAVHGATHRNKVVHLEGSNDLEGALRVCLGPGACSGRADASHLHAVGPSNVQQSLALPEHVALQLVKPQAA
jgi:hypothetical protein